MTKTNIMKKGYKSIVTSERFRVIRKKNGKEKIYNIYCKESGST